MPDRKGINFTKEFPFKNEDAICTSCLLRITLLQNKPLNNQQIYKALHNAIQRRGYDRNLPWKNAPMDDDKENIELIEKYSMQACVELIQNEEYKYPCYYDALRLGLWEENNPFEFKKAIPFDNYNKVRAAGLVARRSMVEKELIKLWQNAQKQIPELNKVSAEEFLYGEYRQAYGSYRNPDFKKYMGTKRDLQGVLGQKIPRFNNRILSKCKLLPKRNVCKANSIENVVFVLLLKLKNLRFTDISGEKGKLTHFEMKELIDKWKKKKDADEKCKMDVTITKEDIEKVTGRKISDKIKPMKANLSGRSSFCRPACLIMTEVILSGKNPLDIDISKFVDRKGTKNGIFEDEIKNMLSKTGNYDNLYIPDNRDENAKYTDDAISKTDIIIGSITNSIVRNRLQIFRNLLFELKLEYGNADEVIFEFVRGGTDNSLEGKKARIISLK